MRMTYRIEVDCPACADKMEKAACRTEGVREAVVNFMARRMKVDFEDGADAGAVMQRIMGNLPRKGERTAHTSQQQQKHQDHLFHNSFS